MFKNIVIILIASILALISFELFLKYSPFEYGVSPIKYDKTIGVWHKKNFQDNWIRECYKTPYAFNDKGLIKNKTIYEPSIKDVIILGDSFIEALMVKNENIIHNALADEFSNKYNFLNAGLSDSSPPQQFIILKEKIDISNTKHVIQFINLENDLLDVDSANLASIGRPRVFVEFDTIEKYKVIPPRVQGMYDKVADFLGNYQIYVFIKKLMYYVKENLVNRGMKIKTSVDENSNKDLTKNWLYLNGALYQTNKLLKSKNINYKVVIISKSNRYNAIIKEFLTEKNIDFIFLNNEVKKMGIALKTFSCDGHWNDETHRSVAKVIKTLKLID